MFHAILRGQTAATNECRAPEITIPYVKKII